MGIILRIALELLSSQNRREVLAYLRVLGKVVQWTEHPRKVVVGLGCRWIPGRRLSSKSESLEMMNTEAQVGVLSGISMDLRQTFVSRRICRTYIWICSCLRFPEYSSAKLVIMHAQQC